MQICIQDLPCIYVWKYIHSGDLYIELSFLTAVLASLLYEMVSVHSQYAAVGTTILAKLKKYICWDPFPWPLKNELIVFVVTKPDGRKFDLTWTYVMIHTNDTCYISWSRDTCQPRHVHVLCFVLHPVARVRPIGEGQQVTRPGWPNFTLSHKRVSSIYMEFAIQFLDLIFWTSGSKVKCTKLTWPLHCL